MKTKIKFKVRNLEYTLNIVEPEDEHLLLNDYYRGGLTNRRTSNIFLSNDLSPQIRKRVLLHELTHAYIYATGMLQTEWQEENVADFIENNFEEIQWNYEHILRILGDE